MSTRLISDLTQKTPAKGPTPYCESILRTAANPPPNRPTGFLHHFPVCLATGLFPTDAVVPLRTREPPNPAQISWGKNRHGAEYLAHLKNQMLLQCSRGAVEAQRLPSHLLAFSHSVIRALRSNLATASMMHPPPSQSSPGGEGKTLLHYHYSLNELRMAEVIDRY